MLHPETSSVLRYIPDTIQTAPDTTQTPPAKGVLCNIGHWKKRPYLIFITFYNILRDLAFIHLRHPETPSRHLRNLKFTVIGLYRISNLLVSVGPLGLPGGQQGWPDV